MRNDVFNASHSAHILDSGKLDPDAIMAKDRLLLAQLPEENIPLIHFYEWSSPCLTVGHFIDPSCHLDLNAVADYGLQIARRPTGGGIIFHLTDFAFSILMPASHSMFSRNTLENYEWINQRVAQAVSGIHSSFEKPVLFRSASSLSRDSPFFCMAKPTPYDLILEGKKAGGAAQRRTKKGLLHQASLSLSFPPLDMLRRVLKDQTVVCSMIENSYSLLPEGCDLKTGRSKIKELLSANLIL